jgi:cysteine desulfurase
MDKLIYLDNNSTTQVDQQVLESMWPFLTTHYGNASSTHHFGLMINEAVKIARIQVAELIGATVNEIVFTSGATEAINLALKGVAENNSHKGKHIITVCTEHSAVIDTCKDLETKGYEVTYLPVNSYGIIDLDILRNSLRADTLLVSVMLANNETGVLQPLKEISKITHSIGAFCMTDATQAVGKIPIDVDDLGVDLLCLSGHKFYAPKGIGALYFRSNIKMSPIQHGGGQEFGLRSGTLNVPGIVAIGAACQVAQEYMKTEISRIRQLRDKLETELLSFACSTLNGHKDDRMYNVSNICFQGFDANVIIGRLKNIAVSNGSACSSSINEPSHVLRAMGLSSDDAYASIRFSLGKYNTEVEIENVIGRFKNLLGLKNA